MEDALAPPCKTLLTRKGKSVLILVLMEDALALIKYLERYLN